ncbi:helix-turn-helix domain-containing protein [Neolewinella xylanilytica]|uniref:helix-turn-helix domain-containing protein n=1 Tax=Neolewinella xylanilytica TaxID=1514080 RepID=UPI001FEC8AE4|nr:AraC family transcriptional regulator [Neolewinella xylanilytica]
METATADRPTVDSCRFEEPLIAVALYGSGNVELKVRYAGREKVYEHTRGLALAFYADQEVEFVHTVRPDTPLECIVIATAARNLDRLPDYEGELFGELLQQLLDPRDHFVEGPTRFMGPAMQTSVEQVFHTQLAGRPRILFYRSQTTGLLAQFFGLLAAEPTGSIPQRERSQLEEARRILIEHLDAPPSLSELSRRIGLNTYKLKKEFKELFGVPVFKYLQNERLTTAHDLLRRGEMSVQEAAWEVGYDSLSSFSKAFARKFGYRPSEIRR